jgi:hypothetical protein
MKVFFTFFMEIYADSMVVQIRYVYEGSSKGVRVFVLDYFCLLILASS